MTDSEHMRGFFDFLKVHHTPRKYWTNSSGWDMVVAMHNGVLKQIVLLV
jgi:hypothetical protein